MFQEIDGSPRMPWPWTWAGSGRTAGNILLISSFVTYDIYFIYCLQFSYFPLSLLPMKYIFCIYVPGNWGFPQDVFPWQQGSGDRHVRHGHRRQKMRFRWYTVTWVRTVYIMFYVLGVHGHKNVSDQRHCSGALARGSWPSGSGSSQNTSQVMMMIMLMLMFLFPGPWCLPTSGGLWTTGCWCSWSSRWH